MTHHFDLATLKAVDIADCAPGFYWQVSTHAGPATPILKLDSGDPNHLFIVHLSGDRLFHVQFGRMPRTGLHVLLPMSGSPIKIEIQESPQLANNRELPGAISVCKEGAYLATPRVDEHGGRETHYVSLQNFTIEDYLPSQQYGTFTTWRLTTSEANPSERTVLLSQDWA